MSIIKAENLSKHFKSLKRREGLRGSLMDLFSRDYNTIKAVDNLTMNIEQGEIVGFIGPNGAGKSTTIKMLIGVVEPTEGTVEVSGFVPFKQRRQYVRNIGVVLGQRTQLWWDLPVIESFKLLKSIYKIDTATYERNLGLFDDLLNISELYSKPVRTMSLGQRMLCDIAASFLHDPSVIFLDEPTIGLDIDVRSKVRKIIRELNAIKKTTILLTSHDVGDIETLARRIILIDKGTILFDGETQKFNTIFGSFRTLKIDFGRDRETYGNKLKTELLEKFGQGNELSVTVQNSGWSEVTLDAEKTSLSDILNHLMKNYPVKDVKIEEIEMESVIRKIYAGALK